MMAHILEVGRSAAPLLTIAIPTFNRAEYLGRGLAQLQREWTTVESELVEIVVSDNCSSDETETVVHKAMASGLPLRYVRNDRNLGWSGNFLQCVQLARGRYVLLLSDDDLIVDGALCTLLQLLGTGRYGVVCMRAYGFDRDFRDEHPGGVDVVREFSDSNQFLVAIGASMTLISSCAFRRSAVLRASKPCRDAPSNLPHLPWVLRAALDAQANAYLSSYAVACQRNNSSEYPYGDVFVDEWMGALDAEKTRGLTVETIQKIENKLLFAYYPQYLLRQRLRNAPGLERTGRQFERRFQKRVLLRLWVAPIFRWPRALALLWGAAVTAIGRATSGDLRRGARFAQARLERMLRSTNRT